MVNQYLTGRKMTSSVILDDTGARSFISLCQAKRKIMLPEINKLLTVPSYEQMLFRMKPEFGFGRERFALIMSAALTPDDYTFPGNSLTWKRMAEHLRQAKALSTQLETYINRINEEWNPTTIIATMGEYLPKNVGMKQQQVYMLVFMPDCRGFQGEILIDPLFTMSLTTGGFHNLIAHELHHSVRNSLTPKDNTLQERFPGIAQVLFWLESEGVANMVSSLSDLSFVKSNSLIATIVKRRKTIYPRVDILLKKLNDAMAIILSNKMPASQSYTHIVSVLQPDQCLSSRWSYNG
ncbi:MAG: hypothetical protein GWP06_17460 [Actinobacteria bacterium]|nr:hypothetical protein [Actinomycetota bacterium]